ncbi:hypothetical protein [Adlercreutzia sp. ZJ141]|uniref:hypothetical protein n=1 Tax=Adlercreutzia sp. ZJ141 TaxID=2709406 RepID=UPI0013EC54F8|nr:hypothetical protein [Adlercreutzia sp. ZJ141]
MAGNDYAQAVDAAFVVVEAVVDKLPGSKAHAVAHAIKAAKPVAKKAAKAAPAVAVVAKPAFDKAKQAAPDAAHKAGQIAGQAGHAAANAAGMAKRNVVRVASSAKGKAYEVVKRAADKRKKKLSQAEALQQLLERAPVKVSATDLSQSNDTDLDIALQRFLHYPGCYAAITYGAANKEKGLTNYNEAHVLYAEDMGKAMVADIEGRGSYDIYADVKHDQNVMFFLYPCNAEDADDLMNSLTKVLIE